MAKSLSAFNGYGGIYECCVDRWEFPYIKIWIYRHGCKYIDLGLVKLRTTERNVQRDFNKYIKERFPEEADTSRFQPLTDAFDYSVFKSRSG